MPSCALAANSHVAFTHLVSGRLVDHVVYEPTPDGFAHYLEDLGIAHFSAAEFTRVRYPQWAPTPILLPKRDWWPRAGALALVLELCRTACGNRPIAIAHWWRPFDYNRMVTRTKSKPDGTKHSDHIGAYAVDADFESVAAKNAALAKVIQPMYSTGLFEMSIGEGTRRLHIGLYAGRGQRRWKY